MKRTYIVPATENVVFADDMMQNPSLSIITGSGAPTVDRGDAIN